MTRKFTRPDPRRARLNSRLLSYATLPVVALLGPAGAQAGQITDFQNFFDPLNWTLAGNGSVDTSGAPLSITIVGPNDQSGNATEEDFAITVNTAGTWSFNWMYTASDTKCYDQGGYLLNGGHTPWHATAMPQPAAASA